MSLLAAVRNTVVLDVDSMDALVASTHAPAPLFSDMTSNQAIAAFESTRPEQAVRLADTVASLAPLRTITEPLRA